MRLTKEQREYCEKKLAQAEAILSSGKVEKTIRAASLQEAVTLLLNLDTIASNVDHAAQYAAKNMTTSELIAHSTHNAPK